jgi:hypothetical protein
VARKERRNIYRYRSLVVKEEFESAQERAKLIKKELIEGAVIEEEKREPDKLWPFQDLITRLTDGVL